MNAVQRLEHENMAKKSKQTTEEVRREKVGEREGRERRRGRDGGGGGQGETRGETWGRGRRARQLRLDSTSASK